MPRPSSNTTLPQDTITWPSESTQDRVPELTRHQLENRKMPLLSIFKEHLCVPLVPFFDH